ncbi:hypothetical protein AGLY_004705, partial [Aphis glycines]
MTFPTNQTRIVFEICFGLFLHYNNEHKVVADGNLVRNGDGKSNASERVDKPFLSFLFELTFPSDSVESSITVDGLAIDFFDLDFLERSTFSARTYFWSTFKHKHSIKPGPHGFGFVGSHSQGVIGVISNSIFLTLPMGLLNFILGYPKCINGKHDVGILHIGLYFVILESIDIVANHLNKLSDSSSLSDIVSSLNQYLVQELLEIFFLNNVIKLSASLIAKFHVSLTIINIQCWVVTDNAWPIWILPNFSPNNITNVVIYNLLIGRDVITASWLSNKLLFKLDTSAGKDIHQPAKMYQQLCHYSMNCYLIGGDVFTASWLSDKLLFLLDTSASKDVSTTLSLLNELLFKSVFTVSPILDELFKYDASVFNGIFTASSLLNELLFKCGISVGI